VQIYHGLEQLDQLPAGAAVTIGNFDGLHLGHQRSMAIGRQLKQTGQTSALVVVTFEPLPLTVLRPAEAPPRITPWPIKQRLLAEAGVDAVLLLKPESRVLGMSAQDFWAIIRDQLRPQHLIEGPTFRFGKGAAGTVKSLAQWSIGSGVILHVVPSVDVALLNMEMSRISSSLARFLIVNGRVRDAALCLGRPFALAGTVVEGYRRGRTIGVPTANLDAGEQIIPADGVYTARCTIAGKMYPTALSIGTTPTFQGPQRRQIEAHLIGFNGDLYGQMIEIDVIDWLRDQRKFPSVDELKQQLANDFQQVETCSRMNPVRPIAGASC